MTGHVKTAENKVVILGGAGMLGTDVVVTCQQQGFITHALDLPEFDIRNETHLVDALKGADAVVNCAAYTNVEKAETETHLAYEVNGQAVGKLGQIAKDYGVWVLHISTDFVFDGKSDRPYVETDPPNPINTYGKSKLVGEQLLIKSGCQCCIMRIQWTYGRSGNNFVTKLISRAKETKKLKVVDDQVGSPTATTEVAKVICKLLQKKPQGLFHFANAGYVSRFEMAKFIFDTLKMQVNLSRCKTSDYDSVARRPLNSRFNCSKIKAFLGEPIKPWQKPLKNFLKQISSTTSLVL